MQESTRGVDPKEKENPAPRIYKVDQKEKGNSSPESRKVHHKKKAKTSNIYKDCPYEERKPFSWNPQGLAKKRKPFCRICKPCSRNF
jgi:hypothetical protein